MRVAIAPRVSSDMQAERGWSYEDQLARGQEWASHEGHTVSTVYGQAGVSAGTANRDELMQIVAGARNNEWDALWIRDLMRFTRSPDDVKHLRAIEFEHGKRIFEDGRPVTLLTGEGELDVNVRVSLGAYQLAQIRKLTSHGKRARASSGKPNWSKPPTGYNADGTLADNADGVRMVFTKFRTGIYSARHVAELVSEAGHKTNNGRPFTADTVLAILRNKWYCGYVGHRGMVPIYTQAKRPRASKRDVAWVHGEHEPLIEESIWLECERIRLSRSGQRVGRATKQHRVYLLQNIAVCSGCGGRMRAHASKYEKPKYRCASRDRGTPCASSHAYVAESKLLPQIDEQMARLILPDEIKLRIVEMATHADTERDVMNRRRKLEGQFQRARQLFEMGDYTIEEYQRRKDEIIAEMSALVMPAATDVQRAIDTINDAAAVWRGASQLRRHQILKTLFDRIVIDVDNGCVKQFEPKSALAVLFRMMGNE